MIFIHHILKSSCIDNPTLYLIQYISLKIQNKRLNKRTLQIMKKIYLYDFNIRESIHVKYKPISQKNIQIFYDLNNPFKGINIYELYLDYFNNPIKNIDIDIDKINTDINKINIVDFFWFICSKQLKFLLTRNIQANYIFESYLEKFNILKPKILLNKQLKKNLKKNVLQKNSLNKI